MEADLDPIVPPSSTQTSNHITDGLDFGTDNGGKMTSEMQNTDLEEGEIESDAESVKQSVKEMEQSSERSNATDEDMVSDGEIVSEAELNENVSEAEFIETGSEAELNETEKSSGASTVPDENIMISDGEFVSEDLDELNETVTEAELNETVTEAKLIETDSKATVNEGREIDRKQGEVQPPKGTKRPHAVLEEKEEESDEEEVPAKFLRADSVEIVTKEPGDGTQEFEIIDDLGDVEEENDGDIYSDDDLEDSEIYAWLDEGFERRSAPAGESHIQKEKLILQERGNNPFEVLPQGWVVITHNSGMPVYLHKALRVCTLARPYFLGPCSVRKHDIPVSAIPCLQYRNELEKEKNSKTQQFQGQQVATVCNGQNSDMPTESVDPPPPAEPIPNGEPPPPPAELIPNGEPPPPPPEAISNGDTNNSASDTTANQEMPLVRTMDGPMIAPPIKIEYAEDSKNTLDPSELQKYCEKLFEFKTITVKKFRTWKDRRQHLNTIRSQSRPVLPSNTKLITCQIPQVKGEDKPKRKEFILNPSGKSYVCILHEYAQHTVRIQPRYVFKELENAQNPYSATVVINDIEYGTGYSSSKKAAKMAAAKETLTILIPEMSKVTEEISKDEDLSFFDEIKIEDPRVYELCNKVGQPSPYQILQECLRRNYGMGDTNCKIEVKSLKHQKSEYSLTVGKRTVTVVCKNKREGKQRAAQAILQELHPHITNLGSLLRLYGRASWKDLKEKKREEHSITELQSQACSKKPNTAVLDKLKQEMEKLYRQKEAIKSKGKLRLESSALPGTVSSLDL